MGLKDAKREKPAQEEAIRDTGNIETAQAVENKKHQKKSKSASDLAQCYCFPSLGRCSA